MAGSFQVIMDKRCIRSFQNDCSFLANVVSEDMASAAVESAEEILAASNALIPVDTGTAAQIAGVMVEPAYNGARVRAGYGVNGDATNPRTGESASSYITQLHEDLSVAHSNGQAKFLETAIAQHTKEFYGKGRMRLAVRFKGGKPSTSRGSAPRHIDYMSPALSRVSAGYTQVHNHGQYLPYPGKNLGGAK